MCCGKRNSICNSTVLPAPWALVGLVAAAQVVITPALSLHQQHEKTRMSRSSNCSGKFTRTLQYQPQDEEQQQFWGRAQRCRAPAQEHNLDKSAFTWKARGPGPTLLFTPLQGLPSQRKFGMEDSEECQEQTWSDPVSVAPQGTREGHLQWAAHSTASTPTPSIMMPREKASNNYERISLSILCSEIQVTSLPTLLFLGNSMES